MLRARNRIWNTVKAEPMVMAATSDIAGEVRGSALPAGDLEWRLKRGCCPTAIPSHHITGEGKRRRVQLHMSSLRGRPAGWGIRRTGHHRQ